MFLDVNNFTLKEKEACITTISIISRIQASTPDNPYIPISREIWAEISDLKYPIHGENECTTTIQYDIQNFDGVEFCKLIQFQLSENLIYNQIFDILFK